VQPALRFVGVVASAAVVCVANVPLWARVCVRVRACACACVCAAGVGVSLSTNPDGSVAKAVNRQNAVDNAHSVVYVPPAGWLGTDTFTFATIVNDAESSRETMTVNVRKCRIDCRNELFNDAPLYINGI
jgi:hypothetical protein